MHRSVFASAPLAILLLHLSGTPSIPERSPVPEEGRAAARLADLDGDGDLDLIAGNDVWIHDGRGRYSLRFPADPERIVSLELGNLQPGSNFEALFADGREDPWSRLTDGPLPATAFSDAPPDGMPETTAVSDLFERYLCLDGTDDWSSAADSTSLDVGTGATDDMTAETFFYVPDETNTTSDGLIWKQGVFGLFVIYRTATPDTVWLRIQWGAGALDYFGLGYNTNLAAGWHHVAVVWDNENTVDWDLMAIYLDGALVASNGGVELTPGLFNTSNALNVGSGPSGVNPATGRLDETRISSVPRYTGGYTVPAAPFTSDADTRALWHFDETPGATSFADSSSNGNTLTGNSGAQNCGAACGTITISPASLPAGMVGASYSETLGADGETAPYEFEVTAGSLPSGLTLTLAGALSGTPSVAGDFEFTVTATDANGCTGTKIYNVSIAGPPTITVDPTSLSVDESGTTDTFTVVLGAEPTSDVVIDVTSADTAEATVNQSQLTFTPGNWSDPQTVTVTGVDEDIDDGDQLTTITVAVNAALSDDLYDAVAADDPTVTTVDDDAAGLSRNPTSISVTEAGSSTLVEVGLTSEPTGMVVVDVAASDTSEVFVDAGPLIFYPYDWAPQAFWVSGVNDDVDDGDVVSTVTLTVNQTSTEDATYDGVTSDGISVTTSDDDSAGVSVTPTTVTVNESGTTATFDVVLTSEPTGSVVIDVDPTDSTEASVDLPELTFGSGDWSDPQTVTVTGVDDALIDGDQVTAIELTMDPSTADATYAAMDPDDVAVTTEDDERIAIVSVDPSNATIAAPRATDVSVTAAESIDPASVTSSTFVVHGALSGIVTGAYGAAGATFQLDPTATLRAGETFRASATEGVTNAGGGSIAAHVWQFTTATSPASGAFVAHGTPPDFGADFDLGDVDGDGDVDLIGVGWDFPAAVRLNDGAGGFSAHPTTPTFGGGYGEEIDLGDLDGDGDLDAVIARWGVSEPPWMNDGAGNFSPHPTSDDFQAHTSLDVALGDLDGDGDLDVIFANGGSEPVYLNDGNGNVTPHPTASSFGGGDSEAIALGDLDGDGDLDAVIGNQSTGTIWLNDGAGVFTAHPTTPWFVSSWTEDLALGDVDGDGDLDMVAHVWPEGAQTWLNDGTGAFALHPTAPTVDDEERVNRIAMGDVDGDGDLDAIVSHYGESGSDLRPTRVWLNEGSGTFSPHPTVPGLGIDAYDAELADLDGDGDIDLAAASAGDRVWLNRATSSVALESDDNPSRLGDSVTFTATVSSPAPGAISGSVIFKDGAATLATVPLSGGIASHTTSALAEGAHSITAEYGGSALFAPAVSSVLDQVVEVDPFGPPAIFSATASSASQVVVSWSAVSGAVEYEIERTTSIAIPFAHLATTSATSYNDNAVSGDTTYLYRVRTIGSSETSAFTPVDAATTVAFTDPVLSSSIKVKAIHFVQERTAIDAMRAAANLSAAIYTNAIGGTIKRIDLIEARAALAEAREDIGLPAIEWTDPAIAAGSTKVKAAHVAELREGTQ